MIYVIIPVHNRIEYTKSCLHCLYKQTFKNFKIIIIDDGSSDGTSDIITNYYPNVMLIKGDGNLWWTAATNIGIKSALNELSFSQDNFILTLNNDVELPENYLESILKDYYKFKPCIVGSTAVDMNDHNKILYAGVKYNYYLSGIKEFAKFYNFDYKKLVTKKSYLISDNLPGRGTLIPFEVFSKIGLFDESNFIHYMADIEFSERAKAAGYKNIVSTNAVLYESYETTGMHIDRLSFFEFIKKMSLNTTNIYIPIRFKFAMIYSKTKYLYFILDILRIFLGYFLRRYKFKN